ncbi:MAG: GatB/YqeY domain-containing protein [Chryseobacterium sp.]|nr:MAG: GatB/YqeY domain-containing protein [Chryseobacterium sp.]
MSLENKINEAVKAAMKEKNRVALDALRAVKAQILLQKTEGKGTELTEEQEVAILQRMVKQRRDSAQQFSAQNREDLAEVENAQIEVIEKFLPEQLSPEELIAEIERIIAETGAAGPQDLGKVMGVATKSLAGKSDGKSISETARRLLAAL